MRASVIWSRVTARAAVVGWVWIYVIALVWATETLIAPFFGYYGFYSRDYTATEVLLTVEGTFLVALLLPARCRRPSDVAQLFLTVTVAIPVLWMPLLYGPLDREQVCKLALCTTVAFGLMWLVLRGRPRTFVPIAVPAASFWVLVVGTFLAAVVYLGATGVVPDLVGFDDVYGQRDVYKQGIGTFGAYLVGWLSGGLFPVMLAVGLYRRNVPLVGASIAGILFLYALSGQKTYLIGVPIVVGTYFMTRRGVTRSWHWFGLLGVVILLVGILDRVRGGYEITSLIVRRGIGTAGSNTAAYVDLLDGAPLYHLRHSVLSMLGPPPYDEPPAILVGRAYYSDDTVANVNFLADGFANFGWVGILGAGVVAGLLLRVYDAVSADLPLGITAPALVFVLQAAANTAILTTIASHGAGVLIGLVALMPATVAVTRWDGRRRQVREDPSASGESAASGHTALSSLHTGQP